MLLPPHRRKLMLPEKEPIISGEHRGVEFQLLTDLRNSDSKQSVVFLLPFPGRDLLRARRSPSVLP